MKFAIAFLLAAASPVAAQMLPPDDGVTGDPQAGLTRAEQAMPAVLTPQQRFQYRRVFLDIDSGRLSSARARLQGMSRGPLHATAEAQILLAQGGSAGLPALTDWLQQNADAPQARDIAALARKVGASDLPPLAHSRQFIPVRLTPPQQPRSARGASATDNDFANRARALLAAKKRGDIDLLATQLGSSLSSEVRAEWLQRAAWDAYLDLDDASARDLGARAADGTGDWAAMGNWVAGLASFRLNDYEGAARFFDAVGKQYTSGDMRSAAAFWAARSHVRCGRPELASERLRSAVALDRDGFYGLLAARTLGIQPSFDWREPDFIQADWTTLKDLPGARRSAALVEIGQLGLADRELRQLAATSPDHLYEPILRLASRLNLPATQYWLAQNPPAGMMPTMASRLPTPDWKPFNGWRVDRDLVFAHAMQESSFITTARSGPGAKGVMQLMPGTARDLARASAMTHREDLLADPAFNVEYGQTFLEQLRDHSATGGLLPKVIAAYNAGPGSVQNWSAGGMKDNGDVLLFVESIPFRETRHYVEVVLRNYWLYGLRDAATESGVTVPALAALDSIAANKWPRFPQMATVQR